MKRESWFGEYYRTFWTAVITGLVVALAVEIAHSGCGMTTSLFNQNCWPAYLYLIIFVFSLFFGGMGMYLLSIKLHDKK